MEAGTLFKMASVYGLGAACVCAVIAARTEDESVSQAAKAKAEADAIDVAVHAVDDISPDYLDAHHRW